MNRGYGFLGGTAPPTDPLTAFRNRIALDYNHIQGPVTTTMYDRDSRVGPYNGVITGGSWMPSGNVYEYTGVNSFTSVGAATVGATNLFCAAEQAFTVFVVARIFGNDEATGATLFDTGADEVAERKLRFYMQKPGTAAGTWAVVVRGTINANLGVNDGLWHCHSFRWNGSQARYRLDLGAQQAINVGASSNPAATEHITFGARAGGSLGIVGREAYGLILDSALSDAEWSDAINAINTITKARGVALNFLGT